MKDFLSLILTGGLITVAPQMVCAEVVLEGIHWQVGRIERSRIAGWQDVRVLLDAPPKLDNSLRVRVVLKNAGGKNEEGVLIRYSMTARVSPIKSSTEAGNWAIPFMVGERRVPVVGANKVMEIPLDVGTAVELYLKRLVREGWWPDRIKIQGMIEPRPGVPMIQAIEETLEIHS